MTMPVQYFRFEAQCRPCSDPPLLVFASAPLVVLVNLPWAVLFILPLIIWVEFRRVWLPTSCLGNCRVSHLRLLHLVSNSYLPHVATSIPLRMLRAPILMRPCMRRWGLMRRWGASTAGHTSIQAHAFGDRPYKLIRSDIFPRIQSERVMLLNLVLAHPDFCLLF